MNHNTFRLMDEGSFPGHENMAVDRALIDSVASGESLPVMRLYGWTCPAITVGYFQKIDETVRRDFCRKNDIPVIRRITGGGTVLHDMEITYSLTVPGDSSFIPKNLDSSFKYILEPLIMTLRHLGLKAVFKPVNDILVNSRKISGSAQTRKKGVIQQHGTLILDINRELFINALKFDEEKLKSRGITDPLEGLTTMKECLNRDADAGLINSIHSQIIKNFKTFMNIDFETGTLTEQEQNSRDHYIETMFQSDGWNLKR